jgi:hypothetical protein
MSLSPSKQELGGRPTKTPCPESRLGSRARVADTADLRLRKAEALYEPGMSLREEPMQ